MDTSEITRLSDALTDAQAKLAAAHAAQAQVEGSVTELERFADRIATLSAKLAMAQEAQDRVVALSAQGAALDTVLASLRREIADAEAHQHAVTAELQQRIRERDAVERTLAERETALARLNALVAEYKTIVSNLARTVGKEVRS